MENILNIKESQTYQLGFIFLILFCIFRPITMLDFNIRIGSFNLLEFFAISISYLLLIAIASNFKNLKLNIVQLTMILFCSYCFLSIFWGSNIKIIFQLTLPFVIFFSIRLFVTNQKQVNFLLSVIIIAYMIPLFGSLYQILKGNVYTVEYLTGFERHAGIFKNIHSLAGTMFFFSVFFYLKYLIFPPNRRYIRYALIFMLIVSFYCIFKTYARTAFLGLFIFWTITLIGSNTKKPFLIFIVITVSVVFLNQSNLRQIFFKSENVEKIDVNTASSGRVMIWQHNIWLFKTDYGLDEKMLGRGLGSGTKGVVGKETEIWSSHNDYLHLLMHLGIVGVFLYLLIYLAILRDIISKKIEKKIKYLYLSILFSLLVMNFVNGITTYQLPAAHLFWTIMGFYYVISNQRCPNI